MFLAYSVMASRPSHSMTAQRMPTPANTRRACSGVSNEERPLGRMSKASSLVTLHPLSKWRIRSVSGSAACTNAFNNSFSSCIFPASFNSSCRALFLIGDVQRTSGTLRHCHRWQCVSLCQWTQLSQCVLPTITCFDVNNYVRCVVCVEPHDRSKIENASGTPNSLLMTGVPTSDTKARDLTKAFDALYFAMEMVACGNVSASCHTWFAQISVFEKRPPKVPLLTWAQDSPSTCAA